MRARYAKCLHVGSPHLPGELVLACESGVAYLWTVGKGFRAEEGNLYFNDHSMWRWCDFSAHPRVMQYADRTGMDLTDLRVKGSSNHTLFRIGENFSCKSGERIILSKYLGEVNAHHHLVTTQYSAYIVDERFACIPMIKWEHMMLDPPMFAQVFAGPSQGGNKVLLGSQNSQELILLQYCGGSEIACQAMGAPQKLSCPMRSLKHLPLQVPHRQMKAQERLKAPAAGFTSIYHARKENLYVIQLTETGDLFYQILRPVSQDALQTMQNQMNEDCSSVTERSDNSPCKRTDNSVNEQQRQLLTEDEGVISDHSNPSDIFDFETHSIGESSNCTNGALGSQSPQKTMSLANTLSSQAQPNKMALRKWKNWLNTFDIKEKSIVKSTKSHWTLKTKGVLSFTDTHEDSLEKDQTDVLRGSVREAMERRRVLTHGGTSLLHLDVCPPPECVETQDWGDDLSQRLTMSWQGRWKDWWEEKLGVNRERKIMELRKKRDRQKQAKALKRAFLSASFTSSLSYQSDFDKLSVCSAHESVDFERVANTDLQQNLEGSNFSSGQQREATVTRSKMSVPKRPVWDAERVALKRDYLSSLSGTQEESKNADVEGLDFSLPISSSCPMSFISSSQQNPSVVTLSQSSVYSKQGKKRLRMGF